MTIDELGDICNRISEQLDILRALISERVNAYDATGENKEEHLEPELRDNHFIAQRISHVCNNWREKFVSSEGTKMPSDEKYLRALKDLIAVEKFTYKFIKAHDIELKIFREVA